MSILLIAQNRKAGYDYEILEKIEAGVVLSGSEVKSLRNRQCQLKDSYISFVGTEAYWQNGHISEYKASSYNNHEPERLRKLLLSKKELNRLYGKLQERGLTCVPLKVYFKKNKVKLEIAIVKGKKMYDKRQNIKKRDAQRTISRALRK